MMAPLEESTKSLKASSKDTDWWMDSGSDEDVTHDKELIQQFKKWVMGVENTPLESVKTAVE